MAKANAVEAQQQQQTPPKPDPIGLSEKVYPSTMFVSKTFKDSSGNESTEQNDSIMEVRRFLTEPAKVSFEAGLTLNIGNYESARVAVCVVLPCYTEEVDDAYQYAKDWVSDRLGKEVIEARNSKKSLVG